MLSCCCMQGIEFLQLLERRQVIPKWCREGVERLKIAFRRAANFVEFCGGSKCGRLLEYGCVEGPRA